MTNQRINIYRLVVINTFVDTYKFEKPNLYPQ
jgi:hypothetical protein